MRGVGRLLLALGAVAATILPALGEDDAVFVEVSIARDGQDTISVTYPTMVTRREAVLDFQNLARWGKWTPTIPEESGSGDTIEGCDSYFTASPTGELAMLSTGQLPWDVFAYAFRRFPRVYVTFDLSRPFFYKGPTGDQQGAAVVLHVRAVPEERLYGFRCDILDGSVTSPSGLSADLQPLAADSATARPPGLWARMRSASASIIALLVLCGALLGVSAFLLAGAIRERRAARQ